MIVYIKIHGFNFCFVATGEILLDVLKAASTQATSKDNDPINEFVSDTFMTCEHAFYCFVLTGYVISLTVKVNII